MRIAYRCFQLDYLRLRLCHGYQFVPHNLPMMFKIQHQSDSLSIELLFNVPEFNWRQLLGLQAVLAKISNFQRDIKIEL
jgi:hypothetical protein